MERTQGCYFCEVAEIQEEINKKFSNCSPYIGRTILKSSINFFDLYYENEEIDLDNIEMTKEKIKIIDKKYSVLFGITIPSQTRGSRIIKNTGFILSKNSPYDRMTNSRGLNLWYMPLTGKREKSMFHVDNLHGFCYFHKMTFDMENIYKPLFFDCSSMACSAMELFINNKAKGFSKEECLKLFNEKINSFIGHYYVIYSTTYSKGDEDIEEVLKTIGFVLENDKPIIKEGESIGINIWTFELSTNNKHFKKYEIEHKRRMREHEARIQNIYLEKITGTIAA